MTPIQHKLARQALGLSEGVETPRNFFVASVRTADAVEWDAMVIAGLATARPYALQINSTVYRLTDAGEQATREGILE